MKLLILGATGGTGREIVRQALKKGNAVSAFVRDPERLKEHGDRITIVRGDILHSSELQKAMEGQDAILSAFGPRTPLLKAEADLLQCFATALTGAMLHTQIRRVSVVSTAFLFKDAFLPPAHLLGRLLFPDTVADATRMEQIFAESGLDWTMVRPPKLTDKPATRKYRVQEGHLPLFGFTISRADVADFMLRSVEDTRHIGKIVGICN